MIKVLFQIAKKKKNYECFISYNNPKTTENKVKK